MRKLTPLAIAISLFASAGCTPAQMAVPRPLEGTRSAAHKVKLDRGPINEAVAFGKWHTTEVDRSWTTRMGSGIKFAGVGMAHESADQPYTFVLTNKKETWSVECVTRFRNEAVTIGPLKLREGTTRIRCIALTADKKRRVEIASMMVGSGKVGVVHLGSDWLAINTEHTLITGQQLGSAAGYSVRASGNMLAAAQTINDRKVWVRSPLAPELKGPVAVTMASILLYREVKASSQSML